MKSLKTLVVVHGEKEAYIKNFFGLCGSNLIKVIHSSLPTELFRGDSILEVHLLDGSDKLLDGSCKINAPYEQLFVLDELFDRKNLQLELEESTTEDKIIISLNTDTFERNKKLFFRLIKFLALANIYANSYNNLNNCYLDYQEKCIRCHLEFEKDSEFDFNSLLDEDDTLYYLNRWYEIFTRKLDRKRKYSIDISKDRLTLIYFSKDKNFDYFDYKLNRITFDIGKFSNTEKKVYLVFLMNFGFSYMEDIDPRNLANLTLEFVDLVGNVKMDFFEGYQHQLVA